MSLEVYTPYQLDRGWMLAGVTRNLGIIEEILNNYPFGVNLPYKDSNGNDGQQFVDKRFAFGMYICGKSLFNDLVNDGQEMLAYDVLGKFNG